MTRNHSPSAPTGSQGSAVGHDGPSSAAHEADTSAALNSSSAPHPPCVADKAGREGTTPPIAVGSLYERITREMHAKAKALMADRPKLFRRPDTRWYSEELPIEIELELFSPGWIDP